MTKQEMFDIVVPALLRQGVKSLDFTGGKCQYRGTDGRKCAVGHLIPDEIYVGWMELYNVQDLSARSLELREIFDGKYNFLHRLRLIHDNIDPIFWANEFMALAQEEGLVVPVLS